MKTALKSRSTGNVTVKNRHTTSPPNFPLWKTHLFVSYCRLYMQVFNQFFSEGSESPTRAGEQISLKTNSKSALLSRPTRSTTFKQTISVPSKASLQEQPPVPVLLSPVNVRIGPVFFSEGSQSPTGAGERRMFKKKRDMAL